MEKLYFLFRNNKQTGPFTLQELVQMSLKSTDLVWIKGQSKTWYAPEAIPELNPNYSLHDTYNTPSTPQKESPLHAGQLERRVAIKEVKNNEARLTSSYGQIYVSLPSQGSNVDDLVPGKVTNNKPETSAALANVESEKFVPKQMVEKKPVDSNVRKERSIEDIKKEYSEWVSNKNNTIEEPAEKPKAAKKISAKGKKFLSKKQAVVAMSVLIAASLFASAAFVLSKFKNKDNTELTASAKEPDMEEANNTPINSKITNKQTKSTSAKLVKPVILNDDRAVQPIGKNTKNSFIEVNSDPQVEKKTGKQHYQVVLKAETPKQEIAQAKKPEAKPAEIVKQEAKKPTPAAVQKVENATVAKQVDAKPVGLATNKTEIKLPEVSPTPAEKTFSSNKIINVPEPETVSTTVAKPVHIDGTYRSPGKKGIDAFDVTVNNNSNRFLKQVAVNIFYYNENKVLVDKKTVYLKNVLPGARMTFDVPGNNLAVSADWQLAVQKNTDERYYTSN